MQVIRHNSERVFETPNGNSSRPLATPIMGASQVNVVRQTQQAGGFNPMHFHDAEEVMVLLTGSVQIESQGEQLKLDQGDTLIIPAGHPHRIQTISTGPAEWLLVAPSRIGFFSEAGERMSPEWAK